MAARLNKRHQDSVRAKIQASQLVNRLQDHALGNIELTAEQIRSCDILLKKSVPDLKQVEHVTDDGQALVPVFSMIVPQTDDSAV